MREGLIGEAGEEREPRDQVKRTSDTVGKYRRLGVTMDNCAHILETIYQGFVFFFF